MPKIAMRESRGTVSLSSPTCFPLNSGRSRRTRQHAVWIALLAPESECGTGIVWQGLRASAAGAASLKRMPGPVVSFPGPSRSNLDRASDAGSAVLAFASSRPRGCGSRTSSWPARSLYQSDNPDQQARANEASNEVADPSP